MAVIFTQTDTAPVGGFCGQVSFCSAMPSGSPNTQRRAALVGGAPSATPALIQVNASDTDHIYVWFQCQPQDGSVWNAGTWTVRFNVSTANASITLDQADICRVNSSCVNQGSIGVQGVAIGCGSTGVKSIAVTGSAQTPNNGDQVMIMLTFSNIAGVGSNLSFLPDQNIDSPLDPPPPPQDAGRNWMYYNTSIRM